MRLNNIIFRSAIFAMGFGMAVSGCDKVEQPALGSYPPDSNPPGGPLKFYTAYDGINADSIRATFANTDSVISYTDGISGQAVQFNPVLAASGADSVYSFLVYPNANDFASVATSFTVSFWMKIPLAKKDPVNADGILALSSTSNFWGNITVFADHFNRVTDSMQLKFHFANGSGDNWDFQYADANMWPSMYDDVWHQVVFSYDASTLTATLYRDGVQFDQKTDAHIVFDGNASSFVVGGFQQAGGINGSYGDNGWMSGFPGEMDQVKLYAEALTSDQVASSFANKQ